MQLLLDFALLGMYIIGSIALLSHFHKVLALSKFALLKCEIEVNPIAQHREFSAILTQKCFIA